MSGGYGQMIIDGENRGPAPQWSGDERWKGIKRPYTAEDVVKLRGSISIEYTLANRGARRLWKLLNGEPFTAALGALTRWTASRIWCEESTTLS